MNMNPGVPAGRAFRRILLAIVALAGASAAFAQTALLNDVHTVTTSDSAPAVEHDFTISTAGTYTVTLSDLGAALPTPAPLASVEMAITQGNTIVGTPKILTSTGSITFNATANATYVLHVIGTPNATLGGSPIEEDVTASGGAKLYSYIDTLADPPQQSSGGLGLLNDTFTAQVTGTYTVTLKDLAFPIALQTAGLLLVDNTTTTEVATLPTSGSQPYQTTVTLNSGDSYEIIAFGGEGSGAAGGLFSVSVSPPAGVATPYSTKVTPIGGVTLLQSSATVNGVLNLGAGSTTLTVNDLQFPQGQALTAAGAIVVNSSGQSAASATNISTTSHTSSSPFTATAGSYKVFAYATPANGSEGGSYAVTLTQGTTPVFDAAQVVGTAGGLQPYSFDANVTAAGAYNLTLTDFQFPGPLSVAQFAAEQNGAMLANPAMAAGSLTISPAKGPVTLLAFAQASGSGGLFGLDMTSTSGATTAFDITQGVGAGFKMTPVTVSSAEQVGVTATDVQFPSALGTLEAAVTSGTTMEGKIIAGGSSNSSGSTGPISGSFSFQATPGTTYFVNVLAQPASPAKAGTYAVTAMPAPVVTLTPSVTTVTSGGTVALTWSTQNATSCTASGGSGWSGSESPSGGTITTTALTATTTFSLNCTGGGGTGSASATVTVDAPSSGKSGGGGAMDWSTLLALAGLIAARAMLSRRARFW